MISGFYLRLCRGLAELISQKKRKKSVYPSLNYAGIRGDFDLWLGKRIFLVLLIGLIGFLIPWTIGKFLGLLDFETGFMINIAETSFVIGLEPLLYSILFGFVLAIISAAMFYLHLYYSIDSRISIVEAVLPDFLMLVASNVHAGMTPFASFRGAARKEFGPLSEEIKLATAKALGTESFTNALSSLSKRIKSRQLEDTVSFFSHSLRSGGNLAKLLETSSVYLRNLQEMKKELLSTTKMYVVFVGFVVVVGTPLLMGVSVQFLKMINSISAQSNFTGGEISSVAFLSSDLSISPEFMVTMGFIFLFINSVLSSFFMGVLGNGKALSGIKNFPLLFIVSSIIFIIAINVLGAFLGG